MLFDLDDLCPFCICDEHPSRQNRYEWWMIYTHTTKCKPAELRKMLIYHHTDVIFDFTLKDILLPCRVVSSWLFVFAHAEGHYGVHWLSLFQQNNPPCPDLSISIFLRLRFLDAISYICAAGQNDFLMDFQAGS